MNSTTFNPMEIDAIGEIMNISLGSSATAVSNLLDHRVDITTPQVSVVQVEDFTLGALEPAIGVEIRYVSGLEGSNIMLLKRGDIKVIVDILMGTETPDEEFELNELTISAACEVMNQMMGAASTALSDFLGKLVNISTPEAFELNDFEAFKREHFPADTGTAVVVRFTLSIESALKSEFINVMSVPLARELIAGFGLEDLSEEEAPAPEPAPAEPAGGKMSQEEIEKLMGSMGGAPEPEPAGGKMSQEEIEKLMGSMGGAPEPESAPAGGKMSQEEIEKLMGNMGGAPEPAPPSAPAPEPSGGKMSQEEIERLMGTMGAAPTPPQSAPPANGEFPGFPGGMPPYAQPGAPAGYPYYPPYPYPYPPQPRQPATPPEPKVISTQPVQMPSMDSGPDLPEEQAQNLDLIMTVPLEVSVEIGRTRRKVQDILAFSKGSLVVLDKLAGDQVDLFVNGQCIAKGDVVVIDDNFGIRITEILKKPGLGELAEKKQ